jgi:hypothetical protein
MGEEMMSRFTSESMRGANNPRWKEGKYVDGDGYISTLCKKHPRAVSNNYVRDHILIAEKVMGKYLPLSAMVHHVDGNRSNNANSNLVVCENSQYHALLHQRMMAFKACGHANWRKCAYCKQYDNPNNMVVPNKPQKAAFHKGCKNAYQMRRYYERKS